MVKITTQFELSKLELNLTQSFKEMYGRKCDIWFGLLKFKIFLMLIRDLTMLY